VRVPAALVPDDMSAGRLQYSVAGLGRKEREKVDGATATETMGAARFRDDDLVMVVGRHFAERSVMHI
jgi:hypothetical protein